MAILKIARMGHPVLARIAEPVEDPTAPGIRRLVADMVDTLADAGGVGLAAPQVHAMKRVVIFHVPKSRVQAGDNGDEEDSEGETEAVPMTMLINPEIEFLGNEMATGIEGCLSLPGMNGMVPRYTRIRYKGDRPDGTVIEREASGYHARVVQHECDHLDGILYPMRMENLSTFGYSEEMGRSELPLGERLRAKREADDEQTE
ncbi:MAG: peptide deformylase [Alphaproteobacteria bacterium]|jgi:peptide deformylase|nr:peptide deformylase [Alphaproteobacteria bacterium]MBT7943848.1 peptide deformylase [Alphaproteobacteria bacterium]